METFKIQKLKTDLDLIMASNEAPQRKGALVAAATKRYRRAFIVGFLDKIILKENLDITPTLAHRLIFELTGRSISRKFLLDRYATKNRTASSKSDDFNKISQLADKYRNDYHVLDEKISDSISALINRSA